MHIGVLKRENILSTVSEGLKQFQYIENVTWVTGPSKTADIEGILIEGVHGPGEENLLYYKLILVSILILFRYSLIMDLDQIQEILKNLMQRGLYGSVQINLHDGKYTKT